MSLPTELKMRAETSAFPQNYLTNWYRQALLTTHSPESGLNALVDYSAAAFGHIHQLTQNTLSDEDKQSMLQYLETLQQHYQQLGYSQDISLAAHYAICATLDDMSRHHIKHSLQLPSQHSHDSQLLQKFHNSQVEQEKFYSILEHISSQPDKYIDLLELMYLCLRFGYKGQYRNTPFGLQQWTLLTDKLYRLINEMRGQHSCTLSPSLPTMPPVAVTSNTPAPKKRYPKFYGLALLIFIFLIIAAGFIFRQTYNTTREALVTTIVTPYQKTNP